jgi:hypothetical protein
MVNPFFQVLFVSKLHLYEHGMRPRQGGKGPPNQRLQPGYDSPCLPKTTNFMPVRHNLPKPAKAQLQAVPARERPLSTAFLTAARPRPTCRFPALAGRGQRSGRPRRVSSPKSNILAPPSLSIRNPRHLNSHRSRPRESPLYPTHPANFSVPSPPRKTSKGKLLARKINFQNEC